MKANENTGLEELLYSSRALLPGYLIKLRKSPRTRHFLSS